MDEILDQARTSELANANLDVIAHDSLPEKTAVDNAQISAELTSDETEILENFAVQNEGKILEIIKTKRLLPAQITNLIKLNKKDINIALARSQKLSTEQILLMLPEATYLAVKFLLTQEQAQGVKEHIIAKMQAKPAIYKEILIEFGLL
ncbi:MULTISPECIES: hypothetical protein [unclassified Campylobacter]|uniref:hypothetical protein n=1 Tax=unclassified Campylobacter TaxID=2593542 RepID=UPI003D3372F9